MNLRRCETSFRNSFLPMVGVNSVHTKHLQLTPCHATVKSSKFPFHLLSIISYQILNILLAKAIFLHCGTWDFFFTCKKPCTVCQARIACCGLCLVATAESGFDKGPTRVRQGFDKGSKNTPVENLPSSTQLQRFHNAFPTLSQRSHNALGNALVF